MFREVSTAVLSRGPKMCAFIEHKDLKLVYKRYASLYFCCGIGECQGRSILSLHWLPNTDEGDNELLTLEIIHNYVELLDQYFGSVCELDIIYNYEKVK